MTSTIFFGLIIYWLSLFSPLHRCNYSCPPYQFAKKKDFGSPDSRFAAPLTNWGHLQNYQISPEMINSTNTKMSDPSEKPSSRNCIKNKKRQQQQHYTRSFASKKPYLCYTKKKTKENNKATMLLMMMNLPWFRHKNKQKKTNGKLQNWKKKKKERRCKLKKRNRNKN